MTTLEKSNDNTRFLILCVCILTALQAAILAVLLLRDGGTQGAANGSSVPDCIRDFGFSPKAPHSADRDCQPSPVNIKGRA